ncbi:MAG: rhamnogalacturonan acetylesterase [Verrucomicrobiaceae bacterium]|nr:MAG: rhamnogalacturonan acetylesterase [Verrucomicrobiaceae bacterium]
MRVENRALGGRSSRSYLREGLWQKVLEELKPGDFVLIQFGHNDNGPLAEGKARASLKGNGEDVEEVVLTETGQPETVHSFGWYLRKYIAETKAKGATPIVCSLVPRNIWKDGKVTRGASGHGGWAAEAAQQGRAHFIDLNEIVARRYEQEGEEVVAARYFTKVDHTHTTPAGARLNAECVVEGLKGLSECGLAGFLGTPTEPVTVNAPSAMPE